MPEGGSLMSNDILKGTWKLISSEFRGPTNEKMHPLGVNPSGMLIYDEHGHVSVQIMRHDRSASEPGDPSGLTSKEIREAFDGYFAYFGEYEANENEGIVTHHIHGSLFPNEIDQQQRVFFEQHGSHLTLNMPTMLLGGVMINAVLVWERQA